jgi:hypothetical protein
MRITPFNTPEGESAFKASLDLWPVTLGSVDGVASEQEVRQRLEISPGAPSSFSNAVESDLPVLLMSSTFDSQTAPSWTAFAAQTLPNSFQVTFPGSGHSTIQYSPCARHGGCYYCHTSGWTAFHMHGGANDSVWSRWGCWRVGLKGMPK